MIVASAVLCLAANIYNEARSEPVMGQYAVAMVTMNRADHRPERVCQTVFAPKQFSWTIKGYKKVEGGYKLAAHNVPKDADAWLRAKTIAKATLAGRMPDFTHGADHYHTKAVFPKWAYNMRPTKMIGRHVFYGGSSQS